MGRKDLQIITQREGQSKEEEKFPPLTSNATHTCTRWPCPSIRPSEVSSWSYVRQHPVVDRLPSMRTDLAFKYIVVGEEVWVYSQFAQPQCGEVQHT